MYDHRLDLFQKQYNTRDVQRSLVTFVSAAAHALGHWLALHFDAETWAVEQLGDYSPEAFWEVFGGWIDVPRGPIDFRPYVYKEALNDVTLYRCSKCSETYEDYAPDDGDPCDSCGRRADYDELDEEAALEYMDTDWPVSEWHIWNGLKASFAEYLKLYGSDISRIGEECYEALQGLENASTGEEMLAAVAYLNHIHHLGNNTVLVDYSDLEPEWVDEVSNGLDLAYDEDEISYFIDFGWEEVELPDISRLSHLHLVKS